MKKKKTLKITRPSQPTDLEYLKMFDDCTIDPTKIGMVDRVIDDQVNANNSRYTDISDQVAGNSFSKSYPSFLGFNGPLAGSSIFAQKPVGGPFLSGFKSSLFLPKNPFEISFGNFTPGAARIPWYFIACVHYLECNFSFKKHLHNGDPLTNYTVRVPANRPKVGHAPPFTFEESAVDALKFMKFDQINNWSLPTILRKLEAFNGFGYYKFHSINSPYLWSFSDQYSKGKYVNDGKFDAKAVSQQMGAAVILKRMEQRALIYIPRH